MQLPRGRFDRFIRDETVSGIIRELGETGYSGSCSGIFGESAAELIFENGRIILAESSGDKGVDTLSTLHSNPGGKVAAELSVYDQAQLKLAREFNPKCIVLKEAFESLFSGGQAEEKPAVQNSTKAVDNESGPETVEKTPEKEDDEIFLDESEIDSIAQNFRSGAKDLLKKINLDHLVVEDKSGEDNND
ncbi:MAG: hypothetical protein JW931_00965 [Methanomicrobiaceae archaeon]|nr:hypothetical protein [Methanomicrobiaceae archaeon]